jgi:hypothetical protein
MNGAQEPTAADMVAIHKSKKPRRMNPLTRHCSIWIVFDVRAKGGISVAPFFTKNEKQMCKIIKI